MKAHIVNFQGKVSIELEKVWDYHLKGDKGVQSTLTLGRWGDVDFGRNGECFAPTPATSVGGMGPVSHTQPLITDHNHL